MPKSEEFDVDRVSPETLKEVARSFLGDSQREVNLAVEKLRKESRIPPPMTLVERNDNIAEVVLSYFRETKAVIGQATAVNFGRWDDGRTEALNALCSAKVDPTEIPEPPLTERARNDRIAQIMVAYYRSERTNRPTAEKVSFNCLGPYEKGQLNRLCSAIVEKEEFMGIPQQPETARDVLKAVYDSGVLRGQPQEIQTRVEIVLGIPYVMRAKQAENSSSDRFLPPMSKNLSQILNNFQNADQHTVEQIRDCLLFPLWLRGAAGAELAERVRLNNLK